MWEHIVSPNSITVSLTPIGADQTLIVKGVANNEVKVQGKPGIPINCYYHVFAERTDVQKLQTEVSI